MTTLSCSIEGMYRITTGQGFILVVIDENTNYFIAIPLYKGTSHAIGEA